MAEGNEGAVGGEGGNVGGIGGDGSVGDSGTQPIDLMTMLPEDIRGVPSIMKFTKEGKLDLGNLAKSYIEIEKAYGKKANAINIPTDKSTIEERAAFNKAMGVPESPDKYGLEAPKDLPKGMTYNTERTKRFSDAAHKLNINTAQLKGLHEVWNTDAIEEHKALMEAAEKYRADNEAEARKEWGADYDSNLSKSDAVIVNVFGEDFRKMLMETGLNNHPAIRRGMFKLSQAMGEHAFADGGEKGWKGEVPTQEKLYSMIGDARYSNRDPAFIKEVENYSKQLAEYNESIGKTHGRPSRLI